MRINCTWEGGGRVCGGLVTGETKKARKIHKKSLMEFED